MIVLTDVLTDDEKTRILEYYSKWKNRCGGVAYWETRHLNHLLEVTGKITDVGWDSTDLHEVVNDISEWRDRCSHSQDVQWAAEAENKILKKKLEQSEELNKAFIRAYLSGYHNNLPELFGKVYDHEATPTDMVNLKKLGFCLEDVVTFVRKVKKIETPVKSP